MAEQLIAIVQFQQDENGAHEDQVFGPFLNISHRNAWVAKMEPLWPNAMFILTEMLPPV